MHEGDSISGFPSVDVFIYLITPQLSKLRDPALDCLQDVYNVLENLAKETSQKVFSRFPQMVPEMMDLISHVLHEEREVCRDMIESVIDAQEGYLYTNDDDYLRNKTDIITGASSDPAKGQSTAKNFEEEIRQRIDAYFHIVIKSVKDLVPKLIGFNLVQSSIEKLQYELMTAVSSVERF